MVFVYEKFIRKPQPLYPVKPPSAVGIKVETRVLSRETLGHVTVRIKNPLKSLVAGDSGSFEIEATIDESAQGNRNPLKWDPTAANPVVISLASPANSGIAFMDENHPEKPAHHHLVRFRQPADPHARTVFAMVAYVVKSDTKAGKHALWMDITAELTDAANHAIHDVGIVKIPFEVDTHLRTKLLMLFVVGIAVFLFIIEWVRVDVVGILMMVLLPELNLINAHDTFRGLSSNAVVAIIGVMIISYGLNRAGLVSRILQPMMGFVAKKRQPTGRHLFHLDCNGISSVMQNTGAAVLFLPAIRLVASHQTQNPRFLGSSCRSECPLFSEVRMTMIGTSPLILLNDIAAGGNAQVRFPGADTDRPGPRPIGGIALSLHHRECEFLVQNVRSDQPMRDLQGQSGRHCAQDMTGFLSSYPLRSTAPMRFMVPEKYMPGGDRSSGDRGHPADVTW